MQMAANALLSGDRVVWIDTSHPLPTSRLVSMISARTQPEEDPLSYLSHVRILQAPSLAHLLALFMHPVPSFPPERTGLVVVDNIATLFAAAYLPGHEDFNRKNTDRLQRPSGGGSGTSSPRGKGSPGHRATPPRDSASTRKFAIMADLMKSLSALAMKRGLAILVLNQMTTKVTPGSGAVLQPAMASPHWVLGLTSRLLIHRNDISPSALSDPASTPISQIRFVTVLKANGVAHDAETTTKNAPVVVLQIQEEGIDDVGLVRKSKHSTPPASAPASVSVSESVSAPVRAPTVTLRAHTFPPSPVAPTTPMRSPTLSPLRPREKSPLCRKRKRGLEAGVIADSDEEDSDEEWESGLDDDGLGAELSTPGERELGGFVKPAVSG